MLTSEIEPFYFGKPDTPLFGCYHIPSAATAQRTGVLLCYPAGREYIRSHRSYQQLASRLANSGFPVLRFDFYGCGDSSGTCEEGHPQRWLLDIAMGIDELQRKREVARVCLIGLRLGATLAAMTGVRHGNLESLVLWDPVVSGRQYIAEWQSLHWEMLPFRGPDARSTDDDEMGGFSLTQTMRADLESIDLLRLSAAPAARILLIDSDEGRTQERLKQHLDGIGACVEYRHVPAAKVWREDPHENVVPGRTLNAIAAWITEAHI